MMPFAARCYVFAVAVFALCAVIALPWSKPMPLELVLLSALIAVVERTARVRVSVWTTASISLVVAMTAVVILPPPGAALVGVVSGLARPRSSNLTKTAFNVAMSAVVLFAGSGAYRLLNGGGPGAGLRFPGAFFPFFASVLVCWVLNSMLVAGALSLSGTARFWSVWFNDLSRMAMPYYASSVLSLIVTALWFDDSSGILSALLIFVPMYVGHWVLSQYSKEQAAYESTISALVQAVEIKDHYTRGHSERVARGSELIARRLDMAEERVATLRYAGLLHDIGKLGVPTRLLAKTGKLTDEEYEEIRQHPNQGVAVIRDITFLTEVYEGVLYHHERLDGRGYPTGKSGDQIPEFARIIGVADAFDAMTSTRSYRAARPVAEALVELKRGAGTQFDPSIVRAFSEALALREAAGDPWQVTGELEPEAEMEAAPVPDERHSYAFSDHDDPAVEQAWHGDASGEREKPGWVPE